MIMREFLRLRYESGRWKTSFVPGYENEWSETEPTNQPTILSSLRSCKVRGSAIRLKCDGAKHRVGLLLGVLSHWLVKPSSTGSQPDCTTPFFLALLECATMSFRLPPFHRVLLQAAGRGRLVAAFLLPFHIHRLHSLFLLFLLFSNVTCACATYFFFFLFFLENTIVLVQYKNSSFWFLLFNHGFFKSRILTL